MKKLIGLAVAAGVVALAITAGKKLRKTTAASDASIREGRKKPTKKEAVKA